MRKLFCVFMCLLGSLEAIDQASQRITSLPTFGAPLVGNFFLPDDYTIIMKNSQEYYLGPKDLKDVSAASLKAMNRPLIHVLRAKGTKSFQDYIDDIVPERRNLPRSFELSYPQWGIFPVVSVKMTVGSDVIYVAYLALNDREGNVLLFHLVYPTTMPFGQGNRPSQADLDFWNDFLTKTTL